MPGRHCAVTMIDMKGTRHTVEVTADSLFEAGALALQTFRESTWVDG
jgi:hypothetical protein